MSGKIIYLINPISGTKEKSGLIALIQKKSTAAGIAYEIMETALMGITINIGIIPMGSGNGLALSAGIPATPSKALDILFKGNATYIDGFYINENFSCMLCGLGFDAQVAHDFAKQKTRGLQTYIKISAINYFKSKPYSFSIRSNEKTIDTDAWFICIANSNQFGNNMKIAPKASLSDGLLDIVIVKKMNKLMLPFSILGQFFGINALQDITDYARKNNIIYFQTPSLTIKNLSMAPFHIDGDPKETTEEFLISVVPGAFKLIHP
jgi:diacylglycerol kinase (ATP)